MDGFGGQSAVVDSGVVYLALIAQYLRRSADAEVIRHDLGLVVDVAGREDIVRAAKHLKLKARWRATWPLPRCRPLGLDR